MIQLIQYILFSRTSTQEVLGSISKPNSDFIAIQRSAMDRSEKREREDGDGFAEGRRVRRRVDEAKGSLDR